MPLIKPRKRLVSFRLSEEEYEDLVNLCQNTGARSTSDLTRDAIRELRRKVKPRQSSVTLMPAIDTLRERVERLSDDVIRLHRLVEAMLSELDSPHGASRVPVFSSRSRSAEGTLSLSENRGRSVDLIDRRAASTWNLANR